MYDNYRVGAGSYIAGGFFSLIFLVVGVIVLVPVYLVVTGSMVLYDWNKKRVERKHFQESHRLSRRW